MRKERKREKREGREIRAGCLGVLLSSVWVVLLPIGMKVVLSSSSSIYWHEKGKGRGDVEKGQHSFN